MSDQSFRARQGLEIANTLLVANPVTQRVGVKTNSPTVSFEVAGTDAVKFPVGNTSQRPIAANGVFRYNSELGAFEGVIAGAWGPIGGAINVGGANTQVLFNDSGGLGATAGLIFNKTSNTLTVSNTIGTLIFTANVATSNTYQGVSYNASSIMWVGNATSNSQLTQTGLVTTNLTAGGTVSLGSTTTASFFCNAPAGSFTVTSPATFNRQLVVSGNTVNIVGGRLFAHDNSAAGYVFLGNAAARYYGFDGSQYVVTSANFTCSGGSILATGDVYSFSSDKRLKTKVKKIDSAIEKLKKLSGVFYFWKKKAIKLGVTAEADRRYVGLIAQEVQAVLPEAVAIAPFDRNPDGTSKSGENYLTVQYDKLVPLLVEANKELILRVEKLEKEVSRLRG